MTGARVMIKCSEECSVGDVRYIDHHAEAIHLVHDIFAELAQAFFRVWDVRVIDITGAVGPAVGVGPCECHVSHAEGVVLPQQPQRIFNGVAALDAHEYGQFVFAVGARNSVGGGDEFHIAGVLRDLLFDGVDQIESPARILAFVPVRFHPDGEELGCQIALARGFKVEVAAIQRVGKVKVLIEKALRRVSMGINYDGRLLHGRGREFC